MVLYFFIWFSYGFIVKSVWYPFCGAPMVCRGQFLDVHPRTRGVFVATPSGLAAPSGRRFELQESIYAWWCTREDGSEEGFVEIDPEQPNLGWGGCKLDCFDGLIAGWFWGRLFDLWFWSMFSFHATLLLVLQANEDEAPLVARVLAPTTIWNPKDHNINWVNWLPNDLKRECV